MSESKKTSGAVRVGDCLDGMRARGREVRAGNVKWGQWEYDPKFLVLSHGLTGYEVDLERCGTSAQTLDWIAQISHKTWSSAEDVGQLVKAMDELLHFQSRLCGSGVPRTMDVAKHLRGER